MKKIGIATLHYSDNYGAVLQAWALRTIINYIPNCNSNIINYVPIGFGYMPCDSSEITRRKLIEKRDKFENFLIQYCGIKDFISREINGEEYDCICVGSDQVWNFTFEHTKNYEYLLPHVEDNVKKISYAASIGMEVKMAKRYEDLYRMYLPQFSSISVREEEHISFVEGIVDKKCYCTIDPTLLLDAKEYDVFSSQLKEKYEEKRYLLLFWLHNEDIYNGIEFANRLATKYDLEIIHSFPNLKSYTFYKDGGYMNYSGIEEFLDLIRYAACVVTNSYHATLFSIQFETPFYIWPVKTMRSRIDALVKNYDILDRMFDSYIETQNISLDINFEAIKNKINIFREQSISYLKKAIGVEENG